MEIPQIKRAYLPKELTLETFEDILPYFKELQERNIDTPQAFQKWIQDGSELDAFLEENGAWRYIKMSIDTTKPELTESYTYFVPEIQPKLDPLLNELNKKK